MSMIATKRANPAPTPGTINSQPYLDPLDADDPSDDVVVTTRRAISRVALVAAETAGRFERETVPYDPMTWMLAPRALFDGASAIEACLNRDACLRGILLHGLSLGLDADPILMDALASDDHDEDASMHGDAGEDVTHGGSGSNVVPFPDPDERNLRLFTATVVADDGIQTVQAFHASLAIDETEVACRLQSRLGPVSVDARIRRGFDPSDPLVAALVSEVMCDTLALIAAEPSSPIAAGLDVNIVQRFDD